MTRHSCEDASEPRSGPGVLAAVAAVTGTAVVAWASGQTIAATLLVGLCLCWQWLRHRARVERQMWHRVAAATRGFAQTDLDVVMRNAANSAAALFSAATAEVETWRDGQRWLVRGDGVELRYNGPPDRAPAAQTPATAVSLASRDGREIVGELRLRLDKAGPLPPRQRAALLVFAAALTATIRTASTYAAVKLNAGTDERRAGHDPLTGLANRRRLRTRCAQLLSEGGAAGVVALLLIDLDYAPAVAGVVGDALLIAAAKRLRGLAGPDDLVARVDGVEFGLLFAGLPTSAVATHRAEAVLVELGTPVDVAGLPIAVEARGGIAVAPGVTDAEEMLRRAAVALHRAKRTGQRMAAYSESWERADERRHARGRCAAGDGPPRPDG